MEYNLYLQGNKPTNKETNYYSLISINTVLVGTAAQHLTTGLFAASSSKMFSLSGTSKKMSVHKFVAG